jgi:hypothetical protein
MPPTAEQLLRQAIRLARAQFDMRCARAVADVLLNRHDDHGAFAYGLLAGMVASYTRPFMSSDAYGALEGKWSDFPGRPELKGHHLQMLDKRNSLLAHNDLTEHRASVIWTRGALLDDRAAIVEARSPINTAGVAEVRELFTFQEERFGEHLQRLIEILQAELGWPDAREVDLGLELERLGTDQTLEEFYATPRRAPEWPAEQDNS